jgi:putative salt-induced outer membrane protein YdiY
MPGATYLLILLYALTHPGAPLLARPAIMTQQPPVPIRAQPLLQRTLPAVVPADPEPTQTPEVPDRWAAAVDLGFASSSGNSDLTSLTTGIRLKHLQTKLFKLEWSIAFRYGESQGTVVARNLQSKLDFDVGPAARVAPFVFAAAERDPFRKLDLRARTGSGVKYTFYRESPGEASVRVAAQYSRENFTPAAEQSPRTDGAWSMEFKGNRGLGENVKLENTTTFTPVFDDFADHNLEVASKISSKISKHLALTLTHAYGYDSTPAEGVERTDQRFQAGLTIDF